MKYNRKYNRLIIVALLVLLGVVAMAAYRVDFTISMQTKRTSMSEQEKEPPEKLTEEQDREQEPSEKLTEEQEPSEKLTEEELQKINCEENNIHNFAGEQTCNACGMSYKESFDIETERFSLRED